MCLKFVTLEVEGGLKVSDEALLLSGVTLLLCGAFLGVAPLLLGVTPLLCSALLGVAPLLLGVTPLLCSALLGVTLLLCSALLGVKPLLCSTLVGKAFLLGLKPLELLQDECGGGVRQRRRCQQRGDRRTNVGRRTELR